MSSRRFAYTPGFRPDGFIDYNNTIGALALTADTWTDVKNNGAGSFTNKGYSPVPELIDTAVSQGLDFQHLSLGDAILIRVDFTITPEVNGATVEWRYELGTGGGLYYVPGTVGNMLNGAGVAYRFVNEDYIYMGDTNTKDNPGTVQVKCSEAASFNYAGCAMQVFRYGD